MKLAPAWPSRSQSKVRRADPMLAREQAKYEHPLPSREYVLEKLGEKDVPLSFDAMCRLLDIGPHEYDLFQRRLGAMARDGQLMQNRGGDWLIPDKARSRPRVSCLYSSNNWAGVSKANRLG